VRRVLALSVVVALASAGCDLGRRADTSRVLFIGNSLTFTNDLPAMVAAIAAAVGGTQVEYRTIALPSYSLDDHWRGGGARAAVRERGWDVVVVQQGPSWGPNLEEVVSRWAREISEHGAVPALMTVWPQAARIDQFPAVVDGHARAARAAGVELLPAGAAWLDVIRREGGVALYGDDAFHPSELGTYLAALVVYAGMSGTPATQLPSTIEWEGNRLVVQPETAAVLREAAARALGQA
jgi:hypothetical protein